MCTAWRVLTADLLWTVPHREAAVVTRKAAMSFSLHQDEINHVGISCVDGRAHLAGADDNGEVVIYDLKAGKLLRRLSQCHDNICASVSFRSGHTWQLVSCGLDGKIVHWNYNKTRALSTFHTANSTAQSGQMVNPRYPYSVACDSSGQRVAAALGDGSLAIYDLQTKKLVHEWEVCENMINAVEWAPFAQAERPVILSGGTDGYVSITDVAGVGPSSLCLSGLEDALMQLDTGVPSREPGHAQQEEAARTSTSACLLKLVCTSQINALASSPGGVVYVGDQGNAILEFDIRNPFIALNPGSREGLIKSAGKSDADADPAQTSMQCD